MLLQVMPAPFKVDWSLAEAMFKEGIGLKQIAKRTGIPYEGLAKRSKRYNWRPTVLAPNPEPGAFRMVKAGPRDAASLAGQWKDKVLSIADSHLSIVMDRSTPDVSLDELEKLVRVLDTTDRTARRTLGLDTDGHDRHITLHVQSEVAQSRALPDPGQIVDVETVPSVPTQDTATTKQPESAESPINPA